MTLVTYGGAWLATAIAFGILDAIWLTTMVPRFYRPRLAELLAPDVNLGAAIAFYLIYTTCLCVLAVLPALAQGGVLRAFLLGAVCGLFAYATYDLTNLATLRGWSLGVTLVDLAWGVLASATTAAAACAIASRL